ncbi:MAG TPA: TorF family putative porin, partial [Mariprofundaceae bacterium]|nr:TorF family putative porin [Mariprofundaceae bacterium]
MNAAPAQADDLSISGDLGAFSQYVWRGVPQNASKAAVQGDVSAALGGLSGTVWFSNSYPSPA